MKNLLRKLLVFVLRVRPIGVLWVLIARRFGNPVWVVWLNRIVRYMPETAKLTIDNSDGPQRFAMSTQGGDDNVVRYTWERGVHNYEAPLPGFIARTSKTSKCFFDIGANSGLFSIIAARCGADSVFAFEPYPPAREVLETNLELNQLTDRIRIIETAIGDCEGETTLYVPSKRFGDTLETSSSLNPEFRPDHSEEVPISVVTMDSFVAEHQIENVDLIHMDVESFEPNVLSGGLSTILTHRPMVVFEVTNLADIDWLNRIRIELAEQGGFKTVLLSEDAAEVVEEIRFVESSPNYLFCHVDRISELQKIAEELGLVFRDKSEVVGRLAG